MSNNKTKKDKNRFFLETFMDRIQCINATGRPEFPSRGFQADRQARQDRMMSPDH